LWIFSHMEGTVAHSADARMLTGPIPALYDADFAASCRDIDQNRSQHLPTITTGKYLKREDLTTEGEAFKVVSVTLTPLELGGGEQETKWVLVLEGLKPLILNATNIRRCVAAFHTSETDEWIGQKIVAYDDPDIEYAGKVVGGVRLRAVPKRGGRSKAAPTVDDSEIPF
jgi:hypothetical protein